MSIPDAIFVNIILWHRKYSLSEFIRSELGSLFRVNIFTIFNDIINCIQIGYSHSAIIMYFEGTTHYNSRKQYSLNTYYFILTIFKILQISTDKLFMLILIICDLMGLNFLYLVRNEGSWLDIGTSISHFIIVQVTVLVLFLLYGLASLLTSADLSKSISFTNKFNKD